MQKSVLIALYNMGGPQSLDDVPRFLKELFNDPDLLDIPFGRWLQGFVAEKIISKRGQEVIERYGLIGGRSPQLDITENVARQLKKALEFPTDGAPSAVGTEPNAQPFRLVDVVTLMRYSEPRLNECLGRMDREAIDELWLVTQYPHCSRATTGTMLRQMGLAMRERRLGSGPVIRSLAAYGDAPGFIDLWTRRVEAAWRSLPAHRKHLLISAHNMPESYIAEGDPYADQIYQTAREVCRRLHLREGTHWTLSWQSAVGPVKWLTPDTRDEVTRLQAWGVENLLLWPIAFVSDHIETLFEVDLDFAEHAKSVGISRFERVPNLNDGDDFVHFLANSLREGAAEIARSGWSPLLRDLNTHPSGEGCHRLTGGCLCGRYFETGLAGRERGVIERTLPPSLPDKETFERTMQKETAL